MDHVEQIKDRLEIADIISGYIKIQKSGVNFKACCPFHNEKTPSFHISPERKMWYCFGCQKGGDMFTFVQEMEGVEFPEALRILAKKAGVELERFDPKISDARTKLLEICELATKFFEKQLASSQNGARASKYLADRGVTTETIKEFRLGFAPNDWQALNKFLLNCGYTEKEIVDAGVAIKRAPDSRQSGGGTYDRFRSRIMFPITDVNGQVVGFTGRIFETGQASPQKPEIVPAKYINTPQTLIYDKSRVLYGLAKSKTAIRQANRCLLVEGNMDALMSFQAGATHVVATSGTALTPEQIKMLRRYTSVFDLCFDSDQAGAMATRRGIGLALSQGCSVNIVKMDDPECKDPADYVAKYGSKWAETAKLAKPAIDFYFEKAVQSYDVNSVESKKSVISLVGPLVNHVTSQVERAHWISRMAGFLRVPEKAVIADIALVKDDIALLGEQYAVKTGPSDSLRMAVARDLPLDVLSEAVLSLFLKNPALFVDRLSSMDIGLLDPRIASILSQAVAYHKARVPDAGNDSSGSPLNIDDVISSIGADQAEQIEFAYLKAQALWSDFDDSSLSQEFDVLIRNIKHKSIRSRLVSITQDVHQAEAVRDQVRIRQLMDEFSALTVELAKIQKV